MPEPSMSAIGNVVPGAMITEGDTFQPTPRSRAAPAPVPRVALPPPPLAPPKFSALIDRVLPLRNRKMLRPSSGIARASHRPEEPSAAVYSGLESRESLWGKGCRCLTWTDRPERVLWAGGTVAADQSVTDQAPVCSLRAVL